MKKQIVRIAGAILLTGVLAMTVLVISNNSDARSFNHQTDIYTDGFI